MKYIEEMTTDKKDHDWVYVRLNDEGRKIVESAIGELGLDNHIKFFEKAARGEMVEVHWMAQILDRILSEHQDCGGREPFYYPLNRKLLKECKLCDRRKA